MSDSPVAEAHRLLVEAANALTAAAESGSATDAELLSVLTVCEGMTRRLDRLTLATIATLQRRGTFAERGYTSTPGALADLLGWERFEAHRRTHRPCRVPARLSCGHPASEERDHRQSHGYPVAPAPRHHPFGT